METLKEINERLGKAIQAAKAIAKEQKDNPEKHAELEKKFQAALADVTKLKGEQQKAQQLAELEQLDTELNAPPAGMLSRVPGMEPQATEKGKEAHKAAFNAFLRTASDGNARGRADAVFTAMGIGPTEKNLLLSTDDTLGGFTVPEDFRTEVIKAVAGFAQVRAAGARVVPTSRNGVTFPTINPGTDPYSSDLATGQDTGAPNSNWKTEGHTQGGAAPPVQNRPTFGQERIPVHVWQPDVIELTQELLEDSAVPLDSILAQLIGEVRALDEDRSFLIGDGVGHPEGISNSGAATVDMGPTDTVLEWEGLVDLYTGLPAQYRQNATWIFNSNTLGSILKFQGAATGNDHPIFPINQLPTVLWQRPYLMSEFMPDFNDAGATVSVILGDFRHYVIAERKDLVISRLVERFAPNVGILPTARLGGQLTVVGAFRLGIGNA